MVIFSYNVIGIIILLFFVHADGEVAVRFSWNNGVKESEFAIILCFFRCSKKLSPFSRSRMMKVSSTEHFQILSLYDEEVNQRSR